MLIVGLQVDWLNTSIPYIANGCGDAILSEEAGCVHLSYHYVLDINGIF
jgi:hypothetical protein